jgi:hypothetical protein
MPPHKPVVLTEDELEALATRVLAKAFITIGISVEDPIEMQKDFHFIRSLRVGSSTLRNHFLITIVGSIATALASLVYLGFKYWSHK